MTEPAPLRVTLNGQQYSAATAFGYNGALNVSRVAPALGPAAGGTPLRVHGYSFEGGLASEYACRFGSTETGWQQVPATLDAGYDELGRASEPLLRCVSPVPPSGAAAARHTRLQVSSNGQQFCATSLLYFYHAHPVVESVAPAAGPTEGGTLVRVFGSHLHGGPLAARRCRFGDHAEAVVASHDATHGALICRTPPDAVAAALDGLSVAVTLNAEHFTAQPAAPDFTRYPPPRPATLAPAAGYSNGTLVTLDGSGVWRDGLATYCRFGSAIVNASRAGTTDGDAEAEGVRCAAPAAAVAGAWARMALDFSEAWAAELQEAEAELHGTAAVVGGELHLTTYHPSFTRDGWLGWLKVACLSVAMEARRPDPTWLP